MGIKKLAELWQGFFENLEAFPSGIIANNPEKPFFV